MLSTVYSLPSGLLRSVLFFEHGKRLRLQDEEKEFFRLKKIIDNPIEQSSIIDFALTERSAQWPGLKQYKDYRIKPLWDIVDFIKGQVTRR